MYVSSLIGQKILFSYYFCLFVSNPKQICSKTFHNRIRGTKSMYYDLKLFYLRKASSYCYICFSQCRLLGFEEVYCKNQSTYSILLIFRLFIYFLQIVTRTTTTSEDAISNRYGISV